MPRRVEKGITIRFPPELVEEIRKFAIHEKRSINSEVVYAVQLYVETHKKSANATQRP